MMRWSEDDDVKASVQEERGVEVESLSCYFKNVSEPAGLR